MNLNEEPLPPTADALIQVGQTAPDFSFQTTSGQKLKISELASRGIVLLNFIKGTWCPFCQQHLENLRGWQKRVVDSNSTILVVSNDSIEAIRQWVRTHPVQYLFGSVDDPAKVFKDYGVRIQNEKFARPATYLLEKGGRIRMAYDGVRGSALVQKCEDCGMGPASP